MDCAEDPVFFGDEPSDPVARWRGSTPRREGVRIGRLLFQDENDPLFTAIERREELLVLGERVAWAGLWDLSGWGISGATVPETLVGVGIGTADEEERDETDEAAYWHS